MIYFTDMARISILTNSPYKTFGWLSSEVNKYVKIDWWYQKRITFNSELHRSVVLRKLEYI